MVFDKHTAVRNVPPRRLNALQRWIQDQISQPTSQMRAVWDGFAIFLWGLPNRVLLPSLTFIHRWVGSDIAEFGHDKVLDLYFFSTAKSRTGRVYVASRQRLKLYPRGFEARLRRVTESYSLKKHMVGNGGVVLDVGANVGEIGLWVHSLGGKVPRYLGIEPDPNAFRALKANLAPSEDVYCLAVAEVSGRKPLWLSTSDADTSLIQPPRHEPDPVWVDCTSLDDFVLRHGISCIDLLKIDAEGSEPEVIRGALDRCLPLTTWLALDVSPERAGRSPATECLTLLNNVGFSVVSSNPKMLRFLLHKRTP